MSTDWFEPTRMAAIRALPYEKKYLSAIRCKHHGIAPVRYTNTSSCVECVKDVKRRQKEKRQ